MISSLEEEFETIARAAVQRNAYTVVNKPLDMNHILKMLERLIGRQASGDNRKPKI